MSDVGVLEKNRCIYGSLLAFKVVTRTNFD